MITKESQDETKVCYNMVMFYTYIYWREDGSPRYVGKGYADRYNHPRHNVEVPPDNLITFAVKDTTEEWAFFMEKELIDKWGRLDDGTGILENQTDGGDGTAGRVMSQEEKDKRSEIAKQVNVVPDWTGKKHTEETRRKISEVQKGKSMKPSEELSPRYRRKKLGLTKTKSEAQRGNTKANQKCVLFGNEYPSIKIAAKMEGVCYNTARKHAVRSPDK